MLFIGKVIHTSIKGEIIYFNMKQLYRETAPSCGYKGNYINITHIAPII